jgi:O-antigen ligase
MIALGLTVPISIAIDSILLGILFLAAVVSARDVIRAAWRDVTHVPPMAVALALYLWLLIRCAYSTAPPTEAFDALGKYLDLILIPVLAWTVCDENVRRRALVWYGVAMVLNLYVSYSAAAGLPGLRHAHYPIGFKASVTHSLMVSLGGFLFLLWAREATDRRWRIALFVLAAICAHNVLFIVIGRTGYVVLGLLLTYFVLASLRGSRAALVAGMLVLAVMAGAYVGSENFRTRIDEIPSELQQWRPGARDSTSVGQRIEFYRTTLEIIEDHPLVGVGTGGFTRAFAEKIRGTPAMMTDNPHNDYLLLAAQAGIPAMVLLIGFYVVTWRYASHLESRLQRDLLRGVVIALGVGGLFNSLLFDHTEGLLLAWFVGLLCAQATPAPQPQVSGTRA